MKKINMLLAILLALTVSMPVTLSFATVENTKESAVSLTEKININTSSAEALTSVPGIGPKTADRIIAYREENGNFTIIDDLVKVKGIGEKSLKKFKPYLAI